jgi:hypothetical protein
MDFPGRESGPISFSGSAPPYNVAVANWKRLLVLAAFSVSCGGGRAAKNPWIEEPNSRRRVSPGSEREAEGPRSPRAPAEENRAGSGEPIEEREPVPSYRRSPGDGDGSEPVGPQEDPDDQKKPEQTSIITVTPSLT